MVFVGFTPPPMLLLTDGQGLADAQPPPAPGGQGGPAAPPRRAAPGVNVLPPGAGVILLGAPPPIPPPLPNLNRPPAPPVIRYKVTNMASLPDTGPSKVDNLIQPIQALSDPSFHFGHLEGTLFQLTAKRIWSKYISDTDITFYLNPSAYQSAHNRIYIRMICIYMVEFLPDNLKILVPAVHNRGNVWKRNLCPTLMRIAKGQPIAKQLNNAAYNNDGALTSSKIKYDRYGKNYKGNRTGSPHLPAPPDTVKYHEYYVDRDPSSGASVLTIGGGSPGVERLWFAPPDWVFYTWNHYGSAIPLGPDRTALTDQDIWAVYSFAQKKWVLGLQRP